MIKFKKCLKCGEDAAVSEWEYGMCRVICDNPDHTEEERPETALYPTESAAIAAWNQHKGAV